MSGEHQRQLHSHVSDVCTVFLMEWCVGGVGLGEGERVEREALHLSRKFIDQES